MKKMVLALTLALALGVWARPWLNKAWLTACTAWTMSSRTA